MEVGTYWSNCGRQLWDGLRIWLLRHFFFFCHQPMEMVEEKEREKCRERNRERERERERERVRSQTCKDQIWLGPRTGTDLGPKSPTNKFVESGRKIKSESRIKILVYSVKRKELYSYIYRKYPRTCPSTRTESIKFFLFAVVFLQPLCSFSFFFSLVFFCVSSFFSFFVLYTMVFYTISSIHVWVRCWESFFSASLASSWTFHS